MLEYLTHFKEGLGKICLLLTNLFLKYKLPLKKLVSDSGRWFWVLFTNIILHLLFIHVSFPFPSVLKTASLTESNTRITIGREPLLLDEVHTSCNKMTSNHSSELMMFLNEQSWRNSRFHKLSGLNSRSSVGLFIWIY